MDGEDMSEVGDDFEFMKEIFGEERNDELSERLEAIEAHCAMIAEGKYLSVVNDIKKERGESAVMELVFAIERCTGWHMEIIQTRADIEDLLFSKYGIYDPKAWMKAKNSDVWSDMNFEVAYAAMRRRSEIVDELSGAPVSVFTRFLRKFVYDAWKRIDGLLS